MSKKKLIDATIAYNKDFRLLLAKHEATITVYGECLIEFGKIGESLANNYMHKDSKTLLEEVAVYE